MTRLTTCPDADSVAQRAAAHVQREIAHALRERGAAHVALSGGATPARTYELLAQTDVPWEHVEIWFADERCVEPGDEQSNYRLAAATLLEPAGIEPGAVHRMRGELGPDRGAELYAAELERRLGGGDGAPATPVGAPGGAAALPVLDVVMLGIGPDGHVASLFPGASTLEREHDVCLGVRDSPKPPAQRITLGLGVLRAARGCVLLAVGAGKADAVSAMLGEPSRHVPASLLRRERLSAIVDDAAAPSGPLR